MSQETPATSSSTKAASTQAQASHDPQSLWQQLLETTRTKPALGWIRSLDLLRMDGNVVHLSLKPGQREMVRFFGDRQRTQLAQMLSDITGQQLKVELQMPTRQMLDDAASDASSDQPASPDPQQGSGRTAITANQRQEVMGLPLVRELMESFDLSLVEVRKHTPDMPVSSDDDEDDDQSGSSKRSVLDDDNGIDDMDERDDTDE